jgi:luciferase-like monooxygenase
MTTELPSFLARRRAGPRPRTTPTNPHMQLSENAPDALQERVFEFARGLPGVVVGPSAVSVPGARAFHLPAGGHPSRDRFMVEREFAHLHPSSDGSLHMILPPDVADRVIENQWAERHPIAGRFGLPFSIVMVYGPRDKGELEVVEDLLRESHRYAMGSEPIAS